MSGDDRDPLERLEQEEPLWIRVHRSLEDAITSRALAPGTVIVEAEISRRLGVSRIPVREALRMLERDGWIAVEPRVGRSVREMTAEEVTQLFEIREFVDGNAAESAARLIGRNDTKRLQSVLDEEALAGRENDRTRIVELNVEFHSEVARLAENAFLGRLSALLSKYTQWAQGAFAGSERAPGLGDHAKLLEAIAAGDAETAKKVAREHVRDAHKVYRESVHQADEV
ncbi:MAG: GntR family transcriptional regulator [Acidimicrobiales bacterium]